MSRTPAQSDASRINGSLSLGPNTPLGRLAASRNSTRHGLTGIGKSLPPDMEFELRGELALFTTRHQPRDNYERDLVRRAALGNLRARRLVDASNAHLDERVRNAYRVWDEARRDEVNALADRLATEPAEAVRLLKRLADGCDYLGDAWESLGQALADQGGWDEPQSLQVLRLLGADSPPAPQLDDPIGRVWACALAVRLDPDPEAAPLDLPEPDEARAALARFVRDQVYEMERVGRNVALFYDDPSRNAAVIRAAFDPSPEAARLERYLKDAERMRRKALDELAGLRRDDRNNPRPIPARNEPKPVQALQTVPPTPARIEPEPAPATRPVPPPPARNEPEPASTPRPVPPSPARNEPGPAPSAPRPASLRAFEDLVPALSGVSTVPFSIGQILSGILTDDAPFPG